MTALFERPIASGLPPTVRRTECTLGSVSRVAIIDAQIARRVAESLTADGLRDRLRGWQVGAQMFAEEVHQGRTERETELREQLGLRPHGIPELTSSTEQMKDPH